MRGAIVATAICLGVVGISMADDARASIRQPTNIPAQELGSALQTLAKDRHFQVIFRNDVVGNLRTRGASGDLTSDDALTQLLSGTGLTYRYLDDSTVTILPASVLSSELSAAGPARGNDQNGEGSSTKEGKKSSSGEFRVAPVDQGKAANTTSVDPQQRTAASAEVGLEEVIVTAQKREERLRDVPISLVVLTSDELKKRQIISIDDLTFAVPDLYVGENGGTARRIEIRGISNDFGSSTPNISIYVDEADVTGNSLLQPDLGLYDLERVEVLRGPQGTLYGEGSAGGTVRFITKKPDLNKFTFDSDVAAMWTQGGAPSQRIQTAANLPLIDGELAIRIAGGFEHDGGWVYAPLANQQHINDQSRTDVRIKTLWKLSDQFTAGAMVMIHRNDEGTGLYENPNGNFNQAADVDYSAGFNQQTTPRLQDRYDLYNLTLSYDLSGARILGTVSYFKQSQVYTNFSQIFQFSPPPAPVLDEYAPVNMMNFNTLTQELRMTSLGSGSWQWTLGEFYKDLNGIRRAVAIYNLFLAPPGSLPPPPDELHAITISPPDKSVSFFGDTSYKFFDRLTLGAGVRYYKNSMGTSYTSCCGAIPIYMPNPTADFHSVDPRFYALYRVSDAINIYSSAAKGFRSGGVNGFFPNGETEPNFAPESIWTYELGAKAALLDGRFTADGAVFYSDYTNYQINGLLPPPAPPFNFTRNGGAAWVKGVEWDLAWHPSAGWMLSFNGNVLKTRFYKIAVLESAYNVGDGLDLVPEYTFTASAQRDFAWNGKQGFARFDYSQVGPETFRNRSIGDFYFGETHNINMLNFTVGIQWTDQLSLGLFAQNLLNDQNFTNPSYIEGANKSRPRTFGANFAVKFD